MARYYINNQLTNTDLQSFVHFLEDQKSKGNSKVDIYIDEADADVQVALEIKSLIRFYMEKYKIKFSIYAKRLGNAGIFILMAVPFEDRFLSNYVSCTYNLLMNTARDELHEDVTILGIEKNGTTEESKNFVHIIEVLFEETKLKNETLEIYSDKSLNLKLMTKLGFAEKTFQPFTSGLELHYFAKRISLTEKIPYNFPEKLQKELEYLLGLYKEIYITRNELHYKSLNVLKDYFEGL